MAIDIPHRLFNVSEYNLMSEAGIFTEDERVELIEGEIVAMSPIGRYHAACVKRLNLLLGERVGRTAIVSVQDPIRLGDYSEPEPDVALLKPHEDFYAQELPSPTDVLLLVEVADTTLAYDRNVKVPLYARAGIPEVWLVNLTEAVIEVYSEPAGGAYQQRRRVERGQSLSLYGVFDAPVRVDDILG